MDVLRLLAAGSPDQRIADELVVILDTVKKHVARVLGMLVAANRTEAVARARQLGLIAWTAGGPGRRMLGMTQPDRLVIPACIGCGAMRQDQGCPGACSEHRIELVGGGDYDRVTAGAAAGRARIAGLRAVAGELARAEPGPGGSRAAYEALQQSARSALRHFKPPPAGRDDPLSPAAPVVVWRCQECGGLDAPQPCIGVCIWRPAVWVDSASYESQRSRAAADREVERSLAGLLRRLAFATPDFS